MMSIQQALYSYVVLLLVSLSTFYLLRTILVQKKPERDFYIAFTSLSGSLFTLCTIFLSTTAMSPEMVMVCHRFRVVFLIILVSSWFFFVFDVCLKESLIPRLLFWLSLVLLACVPFDVYLALPIQQVRATAFGIHFIYSFGTPGPAYVCYAIMANVFVAAGIITIMRSTTSLLKKTFCIIAFVPQTVAGLYDQAIILGFFPGVIIFEFMATFFIILICISEIMQEQQMQIQLQELNRRLEEKVRQRTAVLEQSKERFRSLTETTPDAILITAENGTIVFCNKASEHIFGYTESELIDASAEILMDTQDRQAYRDTKAGLKPAVHFGGKDEPFESVARKKDGHLVAVELSLSHWQIEEKKYASLVARDITLRKRAEQALSESEERFRAIAETTPDAVITADWRGIISYWNKAAEAVFGYTRKEALGQWGHMLLPQTDQEKETSGKTKGFLGKNTVGGLNETTETTARCSDGTIIPIEVSQSTWETGGQTTFCAIIRDISSRKQAEHKLRDYQQQLSTLASELLLTEERERRNIATELHDRIGQSLILAKMKVSSLMHSLPEGDQTHAELGSVRSIIEHTIEDTRSLTFELSPPILYDMGLEPAIEWLLEKSKAHQNFATDFTSDSKNKPLHHSCRIFLFQATRELLTNITKHARAKKVQIAVRKENETIRITVTDDGIGFDTASLATPSNAGTFGHFSIRERMNHLGGSFSCSSVPGLGTRVDLVAPLESGA